MPTTTMTSWSSATSAATPNFTSRKRNVIQSRIPSEPTRIRVSAWLIEVGAHDRRRPWSGCAARRSGPSCGLEGGRDLAELARSSGCCVPAGGGRRRRGAGDATSRWRAREPDGDAARSGTAAGDGLGRRRRGCRRRVPDGSPRPTAPARSPAPTRCRRHGVGTARRDGGRRDRPIGSVLISMKPLPVWIGDRFEALLRRGRALTCVRRDVRILELDLPAGAAGVVDRELEARPFVIGVRRMKMRPGIVMASEKTKNQRRLPDDVKHARGPLRDGPVGRTAPRATNSSSVHAVQPRLARPVAGGRRRAGSCG